MGKMPVATWWPWFTSGLFPASCSLVSLLSVFPTMIKLSLDRGQMPLQRGNKPTASPTESSVTDISRWFVWTVSQVPPTPSRLNSPSSHSTFPCPTKHPSLFFLAVEHGSVARFCFMQEILKGMVRPVEVTLSSPKPTTHRFLYSLLC